MRLLVALEALEARRLATEAVLRRLGPQPEIGPAAMAAKFDRRFRRLPHTNVMNDALAQLLVEPGGSLMIWTPPRAGKSELASRWFPDWWLTHWPTHRIVLTAYGERLPTRHSVAARDIMFAHGHEYGLAVSKAQAEKTSWSLTTGGGVIARGVGSGLTGEDMDCLSGDANIITPEGVRSIASIVESGDLPMVLSFNHETGIREWRPVIATRKVEDRQIVKIHTRSGRVIECTPDHRVYTGRGYVAAANLVAGDRLTEVSAGYPSHQREAAGQSCGEPDNAVHHVSRRTSCEAGDVVASVQHVRGTGIDVYDLQVAGNRNFFANEILVHNCGIIDDPVKDREAAESELIRAKVWDWYSGAFLSRRVPHTRTCVIMTRWRTDDLAGRILDSEGRVEEGGRWRVVHLPALALPPDPEKGIYPDALGRAVGEPLPHPKLAADDWEGMAAHWATQRERSTARDWNALYQGVPFDAEGALVSEQDIRDHTGDAPREFRRLAVGVDPAGGGRDSVGVVVAGLDGEGRVWWLEDRTRRMSAVEWPRLVCEVADRWGADRVVVETNYGGDLGTAAVSQAWGELVREGQVSGLCPLVVSVTARKSKVLRAEPIAQAIRTGRVWFARGAVLRQLTAEWQMWTPGSKWSPGALDAAVHVATELLPALPRGAQITAVDGVSRQQVAADGLAGMRR